MPIYQGTAIKNVFDLINRDNPGLPFLATEETFFLGVPKSITRTAQGHDTEIRLTPKNSSMYRGGLTLTYRRIRLDWLFREAKPVIERFLGQQWYYIRDVLPLMNTKYGLNLSTVDISDGNWMHGSYQPTRDFNLTAKAESLMYTGTVACTWNQGKEELGLDIMTVSELNGIQWPAGNDFAAFDNRKSYGTWIFWDKHFTEEAIAGNWATAVNTTYYSDATNIPQIKLFTDALVAQDLDYNYNAYDATLNPKGVGRKSLRFLTFALPNAAYPELSRVGFSYATIMYDTEVARYNKYGRVVMYFNK